LITYQGEIPGSVLGNIEHGKPASTIGYILELAVMLGAAAKNKTQPGDSMRNYVSHFDGYYWSVLVVLQLLLGDAVFGAMHFAAWNFVFSHIN
jgi:hypothetical protein